MDYVTKQPQAYPSLNQEAWRWWNLQSQSSSAASAYLGYSSVSWGYATPGSELRCVPRPCTRCRAPWWSATPKLSRNTYESFRIPPERLEQEITHLSSSLQGIHSRQYGRDTSLPMFGRELRLPCDLLFGVPPDKEQPTTHPTADLVGQLRDIQNYARQHLKLASDRM
jgi:hypothetical protein